MYRFYGSGPEAGKVVDQDMAYGYALIRCLSGTEEEQQEFRQALVDWYFSSGDWVKKEDWEIEAGI